MNIGLRLLNEAEINQVSGGHTPAMTGITILGTIWLILEIPHLIMGIVEFTNWVTDLHAGCESDSDGHGHGHSHDHVGDYIRGYFCKTS